MTVIRKMVFKFGIAGQLDPTSSFISSIGVISFILFFDLMIGFLEYNLEGSVAYSRMLLTIYKELIQMGISSFIFMLYDSIPHVSSDWGVSFSFAQILLFFTGIWFTVHSLFIMRVSILVSKKYRAIFNTSVSDIIALSTNLSNFQKRMTKNPFSELRFKQELKILQLIFRDTAVRLPIDFDFSVYLRRCAERYAMKTIEIGGVNWSIVVIIVVCNYIRITFSDNSVCEIDTGSTVSCDQDMLINFAAAGGVLMFLIFSLFATGKLYVHR